MEGFNETIKTLIHQIKLEIIEKRKMIDEFNSYQIVIVWPRIINEPKSKIELERLCLDTNNIKIINKPYPYIIKYLRSYTKLNYGKHENNDTLISEILKQNWNHVIVSHPNAISAYGNKIINLPLEETDSNFKYLKIGNMKINTKYIFKTCRPKFNVCVYKTHA